MVDLAALAELLGVRPSWIQARLSLSHPDRIPHVKLGRYPRFDPDSPEFQTWLAAHQRNGYDPGRLSETNGPTQEATMARSSYQKGRVERRKTKTRAYWVLRYRLRDDKGKWRDMWEQLQTSSPFLRDARKEADTRMVEINAINNGTHQSLSFGLFTKSRWKHYAERLKPSTRYSYESILDTWILPAFTDLLLDRIEPGDITDLLHKLEVKGVSAKYRLNVYALLKVMFEVAVEYSLVKVSPVRRKLHRPETERRAKPALTAEQVTKVLSNVPVEYRALFVLLSITILRSGELLGLRWFNVDFGAETLSITHSLWRGHLGTPKTKASVKTFRLPAALLTILKAHRTAASHTEPEDFIFCRVDGSPLDQDHLREVVLYPALRASGIEPQARTHGFHLLRHSGASILWALTKDLKQVQSHARHASATTTADIYIHQDERIDGEAGELLARAILTSGVIQ